jgi:hypothetical protein
MEGGRQERIPDHWKNWRKCSTSPGLLPLPSISFALRCNILTCPHCSEALPISLDPGTFSLHLLKFRHQRLTSQDVLAFTPSVKQNKFSEMPELAM